jgi:hypothetical protein
MFGRFRKKRLSERFKAIKNGLLVDMQFPPFRQFNQILSNGRGHEEGRSARKRSLGDCLSQFHGKVSAL